MKTSPKTDNYIAQGPGAVSERNMRGIRVYAMNAARARGSVSIIMAVAMMVLMGMVGIAFDIGYVISIKSKLQAGTDAAALAGAVELRAGGVNAATLAQTQADTYSSKSTGKNAIPGITVTLTTTAKCLTNSITDAPCTAGSSYNSLLVTQTATVPTKFAWLVGKPSFTVSTTSHAAGSGGKGVPLNVVVVLDTSTSMSGTADTSCGAGKKKIDCAKVGIQSLITQLKSGTNSVGIMVFPMLKVTSGVTALNPCTGVGTIVPYGTAAAGGTYTAVGMTDAVGGFVLSTGVLDSTSNLIKAAGFSPCAGMLAPGGQGTYYGDAIAAAHTALKAKSGVNNQQNVIVMLSDGDASATSGSQITAALGNAQCQEAIAAANLAKSQGTWIFAIGYMPAAGGCSTDTSNNLAAQTGTPYTTGSYAVSTSTPALNLKTISACKTMWAIAGTSVVSTMPTAANAYFYSTDTTACPSPNSAASISNIFSTIGGVLTAPRLLSNTLTQ